MLQIHAIRPHIIIEAVRYDLPYKSAKMLECLSKTPNQWIEFEQLRRVCSSTDRSLRVYASELRSILNMYGYHIESSRFPGAYRLIKGKNLKNRHKEL